MDSLIIRDVRCFKGLSEKRLAPITLLVGENSTGKSTFLAMIRAAWDLAYGLTEPDFNEPPFELGGYNELAHYHGGQGKRVKSFTLGFSEHPLRERGGPGQVRLTGTFSEANGQPVLTRVCFEKGKWAVEATIAGDHIELDLRTSKGQYQLTTATDYTAGPLNASNLLVILELLRFRGKSESSILSSGTLPSTAELDELLDTFRFARHPRLYRRMPLQRRSVRPYAIAPVRTKPRRIYNVRRESPDPEGEHIPLLLARLHSTDQQSWDRLSGGLQEYGQRSGLFQEVEVQRFGKSDASPFLLSVRPIGQRRNENIMDVGYGVSQVLPILVESLITPRQGHFLMQQPEVHLHPRAQAELASFLVSLAKQRKHRFVIETHSDHLVDRVIMEVRAGRMPAEGVAILFFERSESSAVIHEIHLTESGELTGQPESYRRFFLEEELRLVTS